MDEGYWYTIGFFAGSLSIMFASPYVISCGSMAISAEAELLSLASTGAVRTAMVASMEQAMVKATIDAGAQLAITGEVNVQNAMVSGMSPTAISPITAELSDISQNLLLNKEVNLTNSALKIGTGYIGNGLGKTAGLVGKDNGFTEMGNTLFESGTQSFHNNLQSSLIEHNNK